MEAVTVEPSVRDGLTFAWWNTSLAPSGKSRATPDLHNFAANIVKHLAANIGADFIALGEVSETDLKFVSEAEGFTDFKFASAVKAVGKSVFDLGFLYKPSKFTLLESIPITTTSGNRTLKIAQRVVLAVSNCDAVIHVFISHWPSRMFTSPNDSTRHQLGIMLRTKVEDVLHGGSLNPLVILIGDFNDEPFDLSLSEQLKASRDLTLVKKKTYLLYNPFWNYLGRMHSEKQSAGSYYHKNGDITKWLTFDQIIFSHGFVNAKRWELQTECEHIIHIPALLKQVKDRNSFFDHLPVFGTIERVA